MIVALLPVLAAAPAQADMPPAAVLQTITDRAAALGMQITAQSAEQSGHDVVLKGVEMRPVQSKDEPIKLDEIKLENVSEKDGALTVSKVSAPGRQTTNEQGTWSIGGWSMTNLALAPPAAPSLPVTYDSFDMGQSVLTAPSGKTAMSIGAMSFKVSGSGTAKTFDMTPMEFMIDPSASASPKLALPAQAAPLAIGTITGRLFAKGSYDLADGRIVLTDEAVEIDKIGKLNLRMDLSGYTQDFLRQLQPVLANAKPENKAANGMAMMGMMQSLKINSAGARFDDHSITGMLLETYAKTSRLSKDDFVAQAKAMVPLMAAATGDADFVVSLSKAVSDYLDNPKNIEISIAPEQPLSILELTAAAQADPKSLIKILKLKVQANQ